MHLKRRLVKDESLCKNMWKLCNPYIIEEYAKVVPANGLQNLKARGFFSSSRDQSQEA